MKKYENGGGVFNKTSEELKKMSPKERQQYERARAYNEGIKNAEKGTVKGSVSQAIDQTLGPQTSGERTMRTKGYKDRKKAGEYQKEANKKESLIERRKREKKEALEAVEKGMKKGGAVKKGYHKMPDGTVMKDSAHKMKHGGMVGKCKRDGIAVRGKTRAGR